MSEAPAAKHHTATKSEKLVIGASSLGTGLWYPIAVAVFTLIVGLLFLPETHKRDIDA
jgi:hypothetical protein